MPIYIGQNTEVQRYVAILCWIQRGTQTLSMTVVRLRVIFLANFRVVCQPSAFKIVFKWSSISNGGHPLGLGYPFLNLAFKLRSFWQLPRNFLGELYELFFFEENKLSKHNLIEIFQVIQNVPYKLKNMQYTFVYGTYIVCYHSFSTKKKIVKIRVLVNVQVKLETRIYIIQVVNYPTDSSCFSMISSAVIDMLPLVVFSLS